MIRRIKITSNKDIKIKKKKKREREKLNIPIKYNTVLISPQQFRTQQIALKNNEIINRMGFRLQNKGFKLIHIR